MQAAVMVEPVLTPVIEEPTTSALAAAHTNVGPAVATLEKMTHVVEKKLPPNPKKALMVILEEKV